MKRPRRPLFHLAVLTACLAAFATPSAASAAVPSELDPSFGSSGVAHLDVTPDSDLAPISIEAQADGKLVLAYMTGGDIVVARFTADGAPDTGFGTGGTTTLDPLGGTARSVKRLIVAGDGSIFVYGSVTIAAVSRTALWSLTATGQPNGGFNSVGSVLFSLSGSIGNNPGDAVILTDGSIMTGEEVLGAGASSLRVRGRTAAGASTGELGVTALGESMKPTALVALPGNKFAAASTHTATGLWTAKLLGMVGPPSLNVGGSFGDGLFSLFGAATGGSPTIARSFVTGDTLGVVGDWGRQLAYQRTGVDGKLTAGSWNFQRVSHPDYPYAAVVDGGPVAAGSAVALGTLSSFDPAAAGAVGLARFTSDGRPDSAFDPAGIAKIATPATIASGFARQPSGKYVVVGVSSADHDIYLARVWGDATPPSPPSQPTAATAKLSRSLRSKLKASKLNKITGTATGDGLIKLEVAIQKLDTKLLKKSKRCLFVKSSKSALGKRKAVKGKCSSPLWLKAKGTTSWSYRLSRALKPGKYVISARATGAAGAGAVVTKRVTLTK